MLARPLPSPVPDHARFAEWQLADVEDGLPWIAVEVEDQFTPQALGLDRIGAISLGKGCYPGQEIVARLHYRGGNKRACFQVVIHDPLTPGPGSQVLSRPDARAVGTLLYAAPANAASSRGLAILPTDTPVEAELQLESGARVELVDPEPAVSRRD